MHRYLRAIGFSQIKSRTEFEKILGIIMESPTSKIEFLLEHNHRLVQFNKNFMEDIGISVVGEYDEKGFFYFNYSTPYAITDIVSSHETVMINKRVDTDAYTGMCDDIRLGVSLIFYLQNAIEYRIKKIPDHTGKNVDIRLSAFSTDGKILLGLCADKSSEKRDLLETKRYHKLINEAKNGNQEAINILSIDELDLISAISRRIQYEDLYTVVNNSFIPYGSESDNYTIIGTILNWKLITNPYTQENIYYLLINCNNLIFTIHINETDLIGEPMIGRRFKGNIWMQGNVDFDSL